MGGKSDYWRNKLLDLVRGQGIAPPATGYIALWTVLPSASGGGTEVAGPMATTGYQRFAIPLDMTNWNATQGGTGSASSGSTGRISNAVPVTFGTPLASWGTVVGWSLMDALDGGNELYIGQLATPATKNASDPALTFPADALAIYEV